MKKSKIVAPKVVPRGVKVLYSALYNVGSAVEVGQQQPHNQGKEMRKYTGHLDPTFLLLLWYAIKLSVQLIDGKFHHILCLYFCENTCDKRKCKLDSLIIKPVAAYFTYYLLAQFFLAISSCPWL